jgi:hypothetical protein
MLADFTQIGIDCSHIDWKGSVPEIDYLLERGAHFGIRPFRDKVFGQRFLVSFNNLAEWEPRECQSDCLMSALWGIQSTRYEPPPSAVYDVAKMFGEMLVDEGIEYAQIGKDDKSYWVTVKTFTNPQLRHPLRRMHGDSLLEAMADYVGWARTA